MKLDELLSKSELKLFNQLSLGLKQYPDAEYFDVDTEDLKTLLELIDSLASMVPPKVATLVAKE